MNSSRFHSQWALVGLMGCVVAACSSDDGGKTSSQRSVVLDLTPGEIARYALSDVPNADFVTARTRVEKKVPTARTRAMLAP